MLNTDFEALMQYQETDSKRKEEALLYFWHKYKNLFEKQCGNLNDRLSKVCKYRISAKEYIQDVYPTFKHCLDTVNPDRLQDKIKPKWMLYVHLYNYLRSYNRDYMCAYIKRLKNETSMYRVSSKDDEEYNIADIKGEKSIGIETIWEQNQLKVKINEIESTFTPLQKQIFKYRFYSNIPMKDICKKCGVSQSKYSENLREVKERLKIGLAEFKEMYL